MSQNLEDIARLAGVSRSTVSRVINHHPSVSEITRAHVLKVIEAAGFRPNLAARALVTQRVGVISVVIPQSLVATFTDPYFPLLLREITMEASRHDYAVMLWVGDGKEEEERFCERILRKGLFDGVIVTSAVDGDPLAVELQRAGFPSVLIGPPYVDEIPSIDVDNRTAGREATEHLIGLGHQRIGCITGPLTMGAAQNRLQGYKDALAFHDLPIDSSLIFEGQYDEQSGYDGLMALHRQDLTAMFANSDVMAQGVLRAANALGLRVPEDLALVGYDDMPFAATTTPPLTTIHQPIDQLAQIATQKLIALLNETPLEDTVSVLSSHLVVRESCGATLKVHSN